MKDILPVVDVPLVVALITPLFFLFFLAVIFWVYRRSGKETYEKAGRLPLDDEKNG